MKIRLLSIATALALTVGHAQAEDAQGYWRGSIANALPLTVQFNKAADGQWEATLSVPSQNLVTKVEKVIVTPEHIGFALPQLHASYAANWNEQEHAWTGTWDQGRSAPLNLKRISQEAATPKRPQEAAIAARTAPYTASEVSFDNTAAKVTLSGTLTVPAGKGPFPAVVLVHGSGSINRDGEVFGHKPFLVLADQLSRQGIAVLRYDKRGVSKSSGKLRDATTLDLASDTEAALRFLRTRTDVDAKHIGIIGHSEGGLIAPLVASRDPALAFIVMMAAPGVKGDRLLVEQLALNARSRGVPEQAIAKERTMYQALFAAMVSESTLEGANRRAATILDEAERTGELPAGGSKALLQRFGTAWFHALLRYDPAPVLRAVHQPVLAINGERDLQVPANLDLPPIRSALQGNQRAEVKELPELNHLFQTAKTGAGSEYSNIEQTLAPAALDLISAWIGATVR
ncbi:MAG: alpha/beta hydrolase family protein [Massilia sp.]